MGSQRIPWCGKTNSYIWCQKCEWGSSVRVKKKHTGGRVSFSYTTPQPRETDSMEVRKGQPHCLEVGPGLGCNAPELPMGSGCSWLWYRPHSCFICSPAHSCHHLSLPDLSWECPHNKWLVQAFPSQALTLGNLSWFRERRVQILSTYHVRHLITVISSHQKAKR